MNKKSIIKTIIITGVIVLLSATIALCTPGKGGGGNINYSLPEPPTTNTGE